MDFDVGFNENSPVMEVTFGETCEVKNGTNGVNTLSGSYAFTVLNIDSKNKTYTLDSVEGLEVGDVYSVHLLAENNSDIDAAIQGENVGQIKSIDVVNKIVEVDVFFGTLYNLPFKKLTLDEINERIAKDGYDKERNTFRIIAKPLVGTRKIGDGASANGISCQSHSKGAHSSGEECIAYGSFGSATGKGTKAGYAANARNVYTHAKGNQSNADGYGTIAGSENQNVNGKYNIEDTENKFSNIVGNGASDSNRSNSHTLDWDGNAWYAGEITVGTDNKKVATEALVADVLVSLNMGVSISSDSDNPTIIGLENYYDKIYGDNGFRFINNIEVKENENASDGMYLFMESDYSVSGEPQKHGYITIPIVINEDGNYAVESVMHLKSSAYISKIDIYIDDTKVIANDNPGKDCSNWGDFDSTNDFTETQVYQMNQYTAYTDITKGIHILKVVIYDAMWQGLKAALDYVKFTKIQ